MSVRPGRVRRGQLYRSVELGKLDDQGLAAFTRLGVRCGGHRRLAILGCVPRLAAADAQGNSALGLAVLLVLGLTLVIVGRALDHVDALHTHLFEHVQTQRRLASLPPLPVEWSQRERHYVSWIVTWGGVLVLGAFAWQIVTELIKP